MRCLTLLLTLFNFINLFAQDALTNMDSVALKKGKYYHQAGIRTYRINIDSTIYYVEKAIPYFRKAGDNERYIKELLIYNNLLKNAGRFEEYYESAEFNLKETSTLLGVQHEHYGVALNSLSSYYYDRGNFERAIQYSKESVQILEDGNKDKAKLAKALKNLANALTISGDYEQAIAYLEKSLQINKKNPEVKPFTIVRIYNGLGWNYKLQGKIDSADHYYMKSLRLIAAQKYTISKPGEINPTIQACQGAAEVAVKKSEYQNAIDYIRQALKYQTKEKAFRKSSSYEILGRVYLEQGKLSEALEEFYLAKSVAEQRIARHNYPGVARKYLRIADAYQKMENRDSAIYNYHRGLQMLAPTAPDFSIQDEYPSLELLLSKRDALNLLRGKGKTLWQKYQQEQDIAILNQVFRTYHYGIEVIRSMRQGFITQEAKNILAENTIRVYEGAIQAALEQYKTTRDNQWLSRAFALTESNKSLLLLEAFNEQAALGGYDLPDSLLQKDKELRLEIAFYQRKLLEAEKSASRIEEWKTQLFNKKRALEELTDFFEENFPRFHRQKYANEQLDIIATQGLLAAQGQAAVEYFVGEEKIYGFVLWGEGYEVFEIPYDNQLFAAIETLRSTISQIPDDAQVLKNYQDFCTSAYKLYTALLEPALKKLPPEIVSLKIIPDDRFNYIPFELLLMQEVPLNEAYFSTEHLEYVLENYQISYDYSLTWMLKNQDHNQDYQENFIAYAPSFKSAGGAVVSRSCQTDELYQLECSEAEVNAINDLLHGDLRLSDAAIKSAFEQEAARYRIIHMATHACVDEANPLFNKIFLNDDYLSNADLYNTSLNAELVVLSACNTGSGKLVKGEGVLSLARGFVLAGCASSVVSRWSVDDCATAEIMACFYENLQAGEEKHEALRQAKLRFLSEADQLHSHPYYWSAFVAYGDMGAMSLNAWSWWWGLLIPGIIAGLWSIVALRKK